MAGARWGIGPRGTGSGVCGGLALGAEAVPSERPKAVPGTEPEARGRSLLIASP